MGLVGSAAQAGTTYWNSKSQPLTATGYGSVGKGYGSWSVTTSSDGTRSRLSAYLYYKNADNHKVFAGLVTYVNSGVCVSGDLLTCTQKYFYWDASDTPKYNVANTWAQKKTTTSVDPLSDYARAGIRVKLDIPVRPDISSGETLTKGLKY